MLEKLKVNTERKLVLTLNKMGYMMADVDSYTQKFIDFSEEAPGPSLDIGAAFGLISLEILKKGNPVVANDLSAEHLDVLRKNTPQDQKHLLATVPGRFPDDIDFAEESLGSVFASRILHFLKEKDIREGLQKIYRWLKPGGKLFILGDVPFRKNLEKFIPIYEQRMRDGETWPGMVEDVDHFIEGESANLPSFVNFWNEDIGRRELEMAGFNVELSESFRKDMDTHLVKEGKGNFFMSIGVKK